MSIATGDWLGLDMAIAPICRHSGLTDPHVIQRAIKTLTTGVSMYSASYLTKYLTHAIEEPRLRACAMHGMHSIC